MIIGLQALWFTLANILFHLNESNSEGASFGPVIITREGDILTTVARIRKNTTDYL